MDVSRKRVDVVDIQLRRQAKELCGEIIGNPTHVYNFSNKFLGDAALEKLVIIYLNDNNKPLNMMIISMDESINNSDIIKHAITQNCRKIILTTTHITGDPTPRKTDKNIYSQIKEMGNILGIHVLDYIIIAGAKYYSSLENKFLFQK